MANNQGDPGWIGGDPVVGYYGSGMTSLWGGNEKLGPYDNAAARHQFLQSRFHRSVDFCGTCHDVSNPVTGDLAHNSGVQSTADPVVADGNPDTESPVDTKAAFNNFPYKYGIVERTFSEYKAGALSKTLVTEYLSLPVDLQDGAIKAGYESSLLTGTGGNYEDGSPRYFSCQTCHLRPVTGAGCNKKGAPVRKDLPLHDITGGNYWMPDAITYLDGKGLLRLGGGLSDIQTSALNDGKTRAKKQLNEAAALSTNGNTLKVTNLTGHKLISGYPEGRRMWLNIKWFDADNALVREDGAYGPLFDGASNPVMVTNPAGGQPVQVQSILDLYDVNTKIYEAHYGMTQQWANQLISLGYDPNLTLSYNRYTQEKSFSLGQLAAEQPGTYYETFHFVLNNKVIKDNRIPPYGMDYENARKRNALPVPDTQYGGGPVYNYWDEINLNPPSGAIYATIDLLYQPTSWEYIQFLYLANSMQNSFLAQEGVNMLDAWLNTGMATPYIMASTTWGNAPTPQVPDIFTESLVTYLAGKRGTETQTDTFNRGETVTIKAHVVDQNINSLSGGQVFMEIKDSTDTVVTSLQGFSDSAGIAVLKWNTSRKQTPPDSYTGNVTDIIKNNYLFNPVLGVASVTFTVQQ